MKRFGPAKRDGLSCYGLSTLKLLVLLTFLGGSVLPGVGCGGAATASGSLFTSQTAAAPWQHLADPTVGFSLDYPSDWSVDGHVVATQFAVNAECRSVRAIDFEPPSDSGAAAPVEQSFVQVCAKPLGQDDSLDQYMRRVYGEMLRQTFAIVDLNGTRTYQASSQGQAKTIFAQNQNDLIQIIASVAASPEKYPERQAQIEGILKSLKLI